jgi:hypothetical protein
MPAHFPPALPLLPPSFCAYRKRGSNLSRMGGRHKSEELNEEPAGSRFIRHFRIIRIIQSAGCHDTCETAGSGPAPAAQYLLSTLRCRPRATRLRRKASIMPARPLIPLDIIGRLCLLPANEEPNENDQEAV